MELPCKKCGKKGVQWCARADCALFPKVHIPQKQSFAGMSPNLFVGRANYPDVNIGFLATPEYKKHDDPITWTAEKTSIPEILQLRTALVNSRVKGNVKTLADRYSELRSLVAQSKSPVAMDVELAKTPISTMQYPAGTTPHGPSVELKHAALTQNVHIPSDVDKTLNDELTASEQLALLAKKHDTYYLQKIFSAGLLGIEKKLVPTRWSITATDDTIGKEQLKKVRELPILGETMAYTGGHYGNYYVIILLPIKFNYELFEIYVGNSPMEQRVWTDYEQHSGRTNYASDTVGGYYAARLGITELLLSLRRQASVLAFRFVTDEYTNPLGVWVVREAVKIATQEKPLKFATQELALLYLQTYAKKKFAYDASEHLRTSKLLASLKQKSLKEF